MKKCPNCQKEFPDTMRFCQTDGTPLVDLVEESQAEDPLKTTVVRQEDFASSIPESDPYKTTVGNSIKSPEDSGDLLQLPEENFDPMKTMVVAPLGQNKPEDAPKPEASRFEDIKEEIKSESSSPFDAFSQPSEPLPEASDISNDPTVMQPEPPKFNAPEVSPPSFGNLSEPMKEEEDLPQTVMQNPWDSAPKSDSPFSKPSETPISSPFDAPQSPFNQPSSPFDAPQASFENQPSSFDPPTPSFQEPPANQFGSQPFDQMNQGFGSQPLEQQSQWTPPSPPEQSWGNQELGANTPFQPPVVGEGQNKTLPIVSLVFGIISLCCYISPLTGLVALITGFLGMKNANNDPAQFGGKGLAIAGMITGGLFFLVGVAYYILVIFLGVLGGIGNIR